MLRLAPTLIRLKMGPLAWELPYAAPVVLPKKKKKKKKMELARRVLSPTMNVTTQLISKN